MEKQRNRRPRLLTDDERGRLDEFTDLIHYSDRYVTLHRPDYFARPALIQGPTVILTKTTSIGWSSFGSPPRLEYRLI
jgi:hypothetical protein